MKKKYGCTTDVSVKTPVDFYSIIFDECERYIKRNCEKEGYKITGEFSHHKELVMDFDLETGEPYELYKIYSSVEVEV